MIIKKLTQMDFDEIKNGFHACPQYLSFVVGKRYIVKNPSNPKESITVTCTQSEPFALIREDV